MLTEDSQAFVDQEHPRGRDVGHPLEMVTHRNKVGLIHDRDRIFPPVSHILPPPLSMERAPYAHIPSLSLAASLARSREKINPQFKLPET
jgi:hypothetical protein